MTKMADEIDELFNDIMSECKSEGWPLHFSDSVRDRLEKYERNVRKEIVSRLNEEKRAPLFIACRAGQVEVVEYLISTCDADVEQSGSWDDSGKMVSPLWCAAAEGRKSIIECLMKHGGQINAMSDFGTTPVEDAFAEGKFDMVEYLVKQGADFHRADRLGRTCLMEAVGNVKMCEFLLKHGADVDARDPRNNTALHFAIQKNLLDAVKLLLDYGADMTLRSLDNADALQTACLVRSQPIFDHLVERGSYSPGRLADANELMGSRCYRDTQTLEYWRKAIEIRNSNAVDGKPLAKTPSMPKRDCYRNASEFTSVDELKAIVLDSSAFQIQKLLIHERIVGEHHQATFRALESIGSWFAQALRLEYYSYPWRYCFDLWKRALEISVANDSILRSDVTHLAQCLVRAMLHSYERTLEVADRNRDNKEHLQFADVVAIFKLLTTHLVRFQQPSEINSLFIKIRVDLYGELLQCTSYLIYLLVTMVRTSEAGAQVRALVRHLIINHQNLRTAITDDTLLHLCMSCENNTIKSSRYSYDYDEKIFPNLEVTKLLLEFGAEVDARNVDGRTPLHIASHRCFHIPSHRRPFPDQIVILLLNHGANLDAPDKSGETPAHILSAMPSYVPYLRFYVTSRFKQLSITK